MFNFRDNFLSHIPPVTRNLLIINVIIWLAYMLLLRNGTDVGRILALHFPASANFNVLQPVTYMFMHGGFWHLFLNMFALYMFGQTLERMWGSRHFLTFYFVCGLGAAFIQLIVIFIRIQIVEANMSPDLIAMVYAEGTDAMNRGMRFVNDAAHTLNMLINRPMVGASGAIFGILLAFTLLFPDTPLYIMFIPIPIKAKYLLAGTVVLSLFFGIANFPGDRIAHFAHLGGMISGYLMMLYWRQKYRQRHYEQHY